MKKTVLILLVSVTTMVCVAQSGNNQFIPALEIGLPTGDFDSYKTGIGLSAKALIGVGNQGQVSFSTGYSSFKMKNSTDIYKAKISVIPLLVGYRYHLSVVYIEPLLGYGIYGTTTKTGSGGTETKVSHSEGGFTWALGGGVQLGNVDLGVRYQSGHPDVGTIGFIGFHAGYVFSSRKS